MILSTIVIWMNHVQNGRIMQIMVEKWEEKERNDQAQKPLSSTKLNAEQVRKKEGDTGARPHPIF